MNIVKELRKKKGIQQKELAIEIGVSSPTVSDWEANKKDPSGERLKKLARFFGVDELVILGKGVIDLTESDNKTLISTPRTEEARIISAGIDKMPEEARKRAVKMFNLMFLQFAENDKEGNDANDAEP